MIMIAAKGGEPGDADVPLQEKRAGEIRGARKRSTHGGTIRDNYYAMNLLT
jgi:hypothetical protein